MDWWTVGFANVHEQNYFGKSLLQLGAMGGSLSIVDEVNNREL